jgi:hypothetical protein
MLSSISPLLYYETLNNILSTLISLLVVEDYLSPFTYLTQTPLGPLIISTHVVERICYIRSEIRNIKGKSCYHETLMQIQTKFLPTLGKVRNLSLSKEEHHFQVQETLFEKCWNEVKSLQF